MNAEIAERLDVAKYAWASDRRITLPASKASLAWYNVFLATGQDPDRPKLYRTLCIEFYPHGVQFVATDGALLLRTWVDDGSWGDDAERLVREPMRTVTVSDRSKFGIGFIRTVMGMAKAADEAGDMLELSLTRDESGPQMDLDESMSTWRLTLRCCGQRMDLQLHDEPYPDWRGLDLGVEDIERVEGMTLAPWVFRTLGKVKHISGFDLSFGGEERAIRVVTRGQSRLRGLVMPMRRQRERKAPQPPDSAQGEMEDFEPEDEPESPVLPDDPVQLGRLDADAAAAEGSSSDAAAAAEATERAPETEGEGEGEGVSASPSGSQDATDLRQRFREGRKGGRKKGSRKA